MRDILDFSGVKDTDAKKGVGRNIDATFMRSVRRAGCVEITTQLQWEQELPKFKDPDCNMQGTLIGLILFIFIDCSISVTFLIFDDRRTGRGGLQPPQNFRQLRFLGQQEKFGQRCFQPFFFENKKTFLFYLKSENARE